MRLIDACELIEKVLDYNASLPETSCPIDEARKAVLKDVIDAIVDQPTVNQWIPCSERLPEKDGIYLVTITHSYCDYKRDGYIDVRAMIYEKDIKWYTESTLYAVTAWMPLPEPYRGDEE